MKKIVCAVLALLYGLLFCGCADTAQPPQGTNARLCGVWISCYELNPMLARGNFKEEFAIAAERLAEISATDAFIHVRAFGDSLFDSKYYPKNENAAQYDFDVLEYMIAELTSKNIRFHAWINPFRRADGTFSDPSDKAERTKILNGIRELIRGYDISGIHFDDYFYSSENSEEYDESFKSYESSAQNPLTPYEYRISTVNSLIFDAKNAIKFENESLIFSVSPAADIEKNKTSAYADVQFWCESGAVDWIIPQLYFGFEYPEEKFGFQNLLGEWKDIPRAEGVKLIIGLPAYKLGTDTLPDSAEWKTGDNVLARQAEMCFTDTAVSGICLFSYSGIFADSDLHKASLKKLKAVLDDTL